MPRIVGMTDLFAGTEYSGPGSVCGICGRPLTNAASIERGIGPVCAGGGHPATKETENMRSRYTAEVEELAGVKAIVIRDTGHNETRSVTNDAERVIADLAERGFPLTLPVIYQDSSGRWDGMTVSAGAFESFYALNKPNSTDYADARAALAVMVAMRDRRLGDAIPIGPYSVES